MGRSSPAFLAGMKENRIDAANITIEVRAMFRAVIFGDS